MLVPSHSSEAFVFFKTDFVLCLLICSSLNAVGVPLVSGRGEEDIQS